MARSTQDRLGTCNVPRNRPGFHAKNNRAGTSMANLVGRVESGDARKNAGSIVTVGSGQMSVGIPAEKQPIHTTRTNPNPTATV
jgi:hypothetical protein